jgi:peptidoglycan/xylan/chitin deacetylase (PgdA/CDA1 family)
MMLNIKRMVKKAVYQATSWEPMLRARRNRKLRDSVIVLMYHEVAEDDRDIEAWTVVKKSDFIRQMEYLHDTFQVVSLDEAFQLIEKGQAIHKPTAVITFDDGYAGNKRIVLPIAKSMKIPLTIFVSTRAVQEQIVYWYDRLINAFQGEEAINVDLKHILLSRYCINRSKGSENWREIERLLRDLKTLGSTARESIVADIIADLRGSMDSDPHMAPLMLSDLHELADCPLITIGAHSHCHNILTQLSREEIAKSIQTSKALLESWIKRPVNYFAYPNGNYNDMVVSSLKESGFKCSLTTASRPWKRGESYFTIPRIGIGRYDSFDYFKVKISGGLCKYSMARKRSSCLM